MDTINKVKEEISKRKKLNKVKKINKVKKLNKVKKINKINKNKEKISISNKINKSKNFSYTLNKKECEPELFFKIRKLFIDLLKPENETKLELYIMYSNVFVNIFFLDCRYQVKTEKFIKDFLQKYKSQFAKNIKSLNIINK
jgi:hypothetical protein